MRFEIYGLLIIALSLLVLLTFSSSNLFGHYFSWLFRIAAGTFDFMLPLMGIGIGLYVMVKQKWPYFFSQRWIGVFLLFSALLIWYHSALFEQLTAGGRFAGGQSILSVTWEQLMKEKLQTAAGKPSTTGVGGGMLGALGYALLYNLAGETGTTLILLFMLLIGLMLALQISYVHIFSAIKRALLTAAKRSRRTAEDAFVLLSERREQRLLERQEEEKSLEEEEERDDSAHTEEEEKPSFLAKYFKRNTEKDETNARTSGKKKRPTASVPAASPPVQLDGQEEEANIIVRDFTETAYGQKEMSFPEIRTEEGSAQLKVTLQENKRTENQWPEQPGTDSGMEEALSFDPQEESAYVLPVLDLMDRPKLTKQSAAGKNMQSNARKLEATLESFGVQAKVLEIQRGPTVTRYELQPAAGVKVSRIVNLTDDIALALAARGIRIEAPIPGKSAIGIEVPNDEVSIVTLREVLDSTDYQDSPDRLSVALGRDISGQPIIGNLAKMPHLLVAGATGSGKSVCINGIIMSILFKAKPSEVKLMMIDPKMVELNVYNGIPHLLSPVVTDPRRASVALKKVLQEMERRYELFAGTGTRDIERYNQHIAQQGTGPQLPLIVVIVDELADLMMVAPADVEDAICRLAQMARAAGIHLIIATQRPSVDVITGVIKANIPSRIAFGVSSMADSRTILDMGGAEKLLGRGDMLYLPVGASKPVRIQGAFISDGEVERIVTFVKEQQEARYHPDMIPGDEVVESNDLPEDEMYDRAVQLVREAQTASVSLIQRRLRVGYTRAARLVDMMEARGIVGPYEGSKPREVLIPRGDSQIS
nr:DNA translocase FtsK [Aneurinibacillus tyrosinisolvens]